MTLQRKNSFLLIAVLFFGSCNETVNSPNYLYWDVFGAKDKRCESVHVFFKESTLYLVSENYMSLNVDVVLPLLDTTKQIMFVDRQDIEKTINENSDSLIVDVFLSDYTSILSKSGENNYLLRIAFIPESSTEDSLFMKNYIHEGKNPFTELSYEIDFLAQYIRFLQKKRGFDTFDWHTSFKNINCLP